VIEQLTLGVDTLCCKHCRRLPDGRCAWLDERRLDAHSRGCFECGRAA
jgi:hypothetical protein